MNPILIATLCGLTTAVCWGVTDWLTAKNTKKQGTLEINFAMQIIGLVILAVVLFLSHGLHMPTFAQWVRVIEGSVLISIAYLTFVKALSKGAVGIVVPLGNIYPLITLVLSIIFLGQVFKTLQVVAMVGIVLGAGLLAYEKNHNKIPIKELHRETFMALFAAAMWGVAFFVLNPLVKELPWQVMLGAVAAAETTIACLVLVGVNRSKTGQAIKNAFNNKAIFVVGLAGNLGALTLYLGSDYAGSIIIPTVLSSGAPLVASGLSAVVDKETLGALKRAGAVAVVAGIIALNTV